MEVDTLTFEKCLEACDTNTECLGVAYVAPFCYLKNALTRPTQVSHVWGAISTKSLNYRCQTIGDTKFTDSNLHTYDIKCNTNVPGNDLASATKSTF
jgi:hypothetical protein